MDNPPFQPVVAVALYNIALLPLTSIPCRERSFVQRSHHNRDIQEEYLIHIAKEFPTNVLATRLLVVEDTRRGSLEKSNG